MEYQFEWQKRVNNLKKTFPVFLVLWLLVSQTVVFATSEYVVQDELDETRYMSDDKYMVNDLEAYKLEDEQTPSPNSKEIIEGWRLDWNISWGIRVWKRFDNGTEIEITTGSPVALVFRPVYYNTPGFQNATWNCPQQQLGENDSIVVRVYATHGSTNPWSSVANFTTEQLGATQLSSATWTVYYFTERYTRSVFEPDPIFPRMVTYTYAGMMIGHNISRIEGFRYSPNMIPEFPSMTMVPFLILGTLALLVIYMRNLRSHDKDSSARFTQLTLRTAC